MSLFFCFKFLRVEIIVHKINSFSSKYVWRCDPYPSIWTYSYLRCYSSFSSRYFLIIDNLNYLSCCLDSPYLSSSVSSHTNKRSSLLNPLVGHVLIQRISSEPNFFTTKCPNTWAINWKFHISKLLPLFSKLCLSTREFHQVFFNFFNNSLGDRLTLLLNDFRNRYTKFLKFPSQIINSILRWQ